MSEAQLVAHPGCRDVSWILELLIHLKVRVAPATSDLPELWGRSEQSESPCPVTLRALRHLLPTIQEDDRFHFNSERTVRFDHQLESAQRHQSPTVVLVEDPRETLIGLEDRARSVEEALGRYLSEPLPESDLATGFFGMPPVEAWSLWHLAWMGVSKVSRVQIIRMESLRAEPVQQLSTLLEALGIAPNPTGIEQTLKRFPPPPGTSEHSQKAGGRNPETRRAIEERFAGPSASIAEALGYRVPLKPGPLAGPRLEPLFDSAARNQLERALTAYQEGEIRKAKSILRAGIHVASAQPSSRLTLASALVALGWTERIFGSALASSPAGQSVFGSFAEFLERGVEHPAIQARLRKALSQATETEHTPAKSLRSPGAQVIPPSMAPVEMNYKGFDIYTFRSQFCALARSVGHLTLDELTEETLAELRRRGELFEDQFTMDLKVKIDLLVDGRRPIAA